MELNNIFDQKKKRLYFVQILFRQINKKFIFRFLLQQDANLIKAIDNLNRTALHYAYALKNQSMINLLLASKINKFVIF